MAFVLVKAGSQSGKRERRDHTDRGRHAATYAMEGYGFVLSAWPQKRQYDYDQEHAG